MHACLGRAGKAPHSLRLALQCMDFFLPLLQQDPEIAAIIAEALAHFDQAPAAVCMLSQHLTRTPKSSAMLIMQSKLLVKMNEPEKALQVCKQHLFWACSAHVSLMHMCPPGGQVRSGHIAGPGAAMDQPFPRICCQ